MSVPIVNFGFSEEYKEEVLGIRSEEGVEITAAGLGEQMNDLADLGLEEWLEAHADVLDALEEAWDNITGIVGLYELGEFIETRNVFNQLTEAWTSHTTWIGSGTLKGGIKKGAAKQCALMIMIFLDQFLPYLEDKVEKMERDVEERLNEKLEKLGEQEGGGGSASDDDIEELHDEAIDEFLDEMDPDDIEPEDIDDLADAFDDLAEEMDQYEDDLDEAEAEFDFDHSEVDFDKELRERFLELKKQLLLHNSALDKLVGRVEGYLRGKRRPDRGPMLDRDEG